MVERKKMIDFFQKKRSTLQLFYKRHRKLCLSATIIIGCFLLFLAIPVPKFHVPYSTVVNAADGQLLGARIAEDGQWRFPATNRFSDKYIKCLLTFEDRYFFLHGGFNFVSFFNAALENHQAGKIVRGGSTISMQVVRLTRGNRKRTYSEKLLEVVLAMRLELHYSKREIIELYAAHAPFGGNVVGIDAASWRYFNTSPEQLTWSEAATLAVLPNSPALVHLGKSRPLLEKKRNALLQKLLNTKIVLPRKIRKNTAFSQDDFELAVMEKIPEKPFDLPMQAYHLVAEYEKSHKGKTIASDIQFDVQNAVNEIVKSHYKINSANAIENCGVYVVDYQNKKIISYVGNVLEAKDAAMVDMVKAQRSTGSILKPFLYAAMMDAGELLPSMVIPDIPINLSGYTPKNYSGEYWGAVPADEALSNSLNTPFVHLLRKFSYPKFYNILKNMNITGLVYPADHYGLSLILGGAEASLFDIVNAYGNMARYLKYDSLLFDQATVSAAPFSKTAIAQTLQAMLNLNRPHDQTGWRFFSSSQKIAWKTGTSFGFKDAWSIGITDHYVVGVWVGNSSGEGRPGLTGFNVAAPIMFDVFSKLNDSYTFDGKTEEAMYVEVCSESGYPKSQNCPHTKTVLMPDCEIMTGVCPYHQKIFLDSTRQFQVFPNCYDVNPNCYEIYYLLPPVMEWFYKKHSPLYRSIPPVYDGCRNSDAQVMSFIYPENSATLIIPIGIKGDKQAIIFEIAHRNSEKEIFWNLNEHFIGKTKHVHQMSIDANPGNYILRCIDENGNEIVRKFKIAE